MKVSLAAQTFSEQYTQHCYAIKQFFHTNFLLGMQDILKKFESIKFCNGKVPPCIKGWMVTIKSILELSYELKTEYNIPFLKTRRLNQDSLENLLATIRQQHGCSSNPSPQQFKHGIKHIFITQLSKIPSITNCKDDFQSFCLKLSEIHTFKTDEAHNTEDTYNIAKTISDDSSIVEDVESFGENNVIYYIIGFLCTKFLNSVNCEFCKSILLDTEQPLFEEYKLFTTLKNDPNTVGLLFSKSSIFKIIWSWEEMFGQCIDNTLHVQNVSCVLANIIKQAFPIILCD